LKQAIIDKEAAVKVAIEKESLEAALLEYKKLYPKLDKKKSALSLRKIGLFGQEYYSIDYEWPKTEDIFSF